MLADALASPKRILDVTNKPGEFARRPLKDLLILSQEWEKGQEVFPNPSAEGSGSLTDK